MRLREAPEGVRIDCRTYSVTLLPGRPYARLADATGTHVADLALLADLDTAEGLDETTSVERSEVGLDANGWRVEIVASSSRWSAKRLVLRGDERWVWFEAAVEGTGRLTDVRLLGGRYSGDPRHGTGEWLSRAAFRTVFSPEPADPARVARPASEPASLDVMGGGGRPGMGHWFFTPPPFCFGFAAGEPTAGEAAAMPAAPAVPAGPWTTLGLAERVEAMTFTSFRYEPAERAFSLGLRYEGQTRVDGEWRAPALLFRFGDEDPYRGVGQYARELRRLGYSPAPAAPPEPPEWWRGAIFCGWGSQSREAALAAAGAEAAAGAGAGAEAGAPTPEPVPAYSRQALYDRWLAVLAEHDLQPATVVVDDKWQATYGDCEPDPDKWPDLRRWIAERHAEGRRVLLWWKAWDPEGLPRELCVRNAAGVAVTADPTNPAYEERLRRSVRRMLGPDGLDADGLKVDFTAQTPSGPGLTRHGADWGVALLHRLLRIVADEARLARPDALVVTHAPNPGFDDVNGMLRLNDMLRFDEPDDESAVVPQMLHRFQIVRAACPGVLVDTDDWCSPDLATWRAYQRLKPEIGVPALYYAEGLDRTVEPFEPADYELLREIWRVPAPAVANPRPAQSFSDTTAPELGARPDSGSSRGAPDA